MRIVRALIATIALTSAVIGTAHAAHAEEQADARGDPRRDNRKVIHLEAIKVEGRIQKPQAFYILQRSNLNFEGLELKQSFVPKIVESVRNAPF